MLHERLKEARTKAGLSQEKVAKECGITQPVYLWIFSADTATKSKKSSLWSTYQNQQLTL